MKIVGSGIDRQRHQCILVGFRLFNAYVAFLVKHPRNRTRLTHVAAVLCKDVPDFTHRAVPVVRNHIHQHGHAARGISFVHDFVKLAALELSRALLNGSLDIVRRHIDAFGVLDRFAQPRIAFRVAATDTRRDGDFLDELREHASTLCINGAFFVFDAVPLGMARHRLLLGFCPVRLQFSTAKEREE